MKFLVIKQYFGQDRGYASIEDGDDSDEIYERYGRNTGYNIMVVPLDDELMELILNSNLDRVS